MLGSPNCWRMSICCLYIIMPFWLDTFLDSLWISMKSASINSFPLVSNLHFKTIFVTVFLMLSHFSCVWLFVTPWTVDHQASLSMELFRQEYWSGLPFPSPGDLPNPGMLSSCRQILYLCAMGESHIRLKEGSRITPDFLALSTK